MSFVRTGRFGRGRPEPLSRAVEVQVEERRSTRTGHVCSGTLACPRCDAPVAAGEQGLKLTEELACPFCAHREPARAFLSLEAPTRPAHVAVRVTIPGV